MARVRSALAAGALAALGAAITLFVQPTFLDSAVAHVALDGLFVGATVYLGLRGLERVGGG